MWLLKSTFFSVLNIDLLCLCITITEIKNEPVEHWDYLHYSEILSCV